MEVADGRTIYRKKVKAENMEKVEKFFSDNKGSTITECSKATGLHRVTVSNLIKEIQGE